ncbi:MAG: hypothetical protein M3Y72_10515 [Acidobacteriota bacterium]|nr:hypothetical protein [Acidobacteriota bacterium]
MTKFVGLLAVATCGLSLGDSLLLKDGTRITGVYLGGDARLIKFDVGDRITSYSVGDVDSVRFASSSPSVDSAAPPPAAELRRNVYRTGRQIIPTNTPIVVRLIDPIRSDSASTGSVYRATIDTPIYAAGTIVVPAYSSAVVQIMARNQSGRLEGRTSLTLALKSVEVGSKSYDAETTNYVHASTGRGSETAKIAGGTAALGAIIGAVACGGRGAASGAGSGVAAGTAAAVLRPGQKINLPSESKLIFHLATPLTIQAGKVGPAAEDSPLLPAGLSNSH